MWGVSLVLLSPSSSPILRGPQNLGCGSRVAGLQLTLTVSCSLPARIPPLGDRLFPFNLDPFSDL